jgi:hypothetical protein
VDCWDFYGKHFNQNIENDTTEFWNDCIFDHVETVECGAAGNNSYFTPFIFLNEPLYVSIGGLNPIPINYLTIPLIQPENPSGMMLLIGLDVLNQYTSTISKFNGEVQLRITEQREERYFLI